MAFRAQADISNMEFVQFHPTGFWTGSQAAGSTFLISEAVRGEGELQLWTVTLPAGLRFMYWFWGRPACCPVVQQPVVAGTPLHQLMHAGHDAIL